MSSSASPGKAAALLFKDMLYLTQVLLLQHDIIVHYSNICFTGIECSVTVGFEDSSLEQMLERMFFGEF